MAIVARKIVSTPKQKRNDTYMQTQPFPHLNFRFARGVLAFALTFLLVLVLAACADPVERVEEFGKEMAGEAIEQVEEQIIGALVEGAPTEGVEKALEGATVEPPPSNAPDATVEVAPRIIPLQGDLANRGAEVSSMAWMGDALVIMPQYTNFVDSTRDVWYTLPKSEILAWVRGEITGSLSPAQLPVITNDIARQIPGYEGFESIAFDDAGSVYLTSEATANWVTAAWLVHGTVAADGSAVTLHPEPMTWIEPQSLTLNHSDESLVLTPDDGLFTLYEVNGAEVNTSAVPLAHTFGRDLSSRGAIPFPSVEYRVTDATALDAENRFWAINYFFPNDTALANDSDPIAEEFGEGATHAASPQVERLLEFQWLGDRIERTATPPIQLQLSLLSRNWEGIVRLVDGDEELGFLIVTDQFPDTILAFVPRH